MRKKKLYNDCFLCYKSSVAQDSQVNIRFDEATSADLSTTAKALGISKSQLVRHLTKTFLQDVKATGSLRISPQWSGLLGKADARSEWGERKICPRATMMNDEPSEPMPAQKPVVYQGKKGKK